MLSVFQNQKNHIRTHALVALCAPQSLRVLDFQCDNIKCDYLATACHKNQPKNDAFWFISMKIENYFLSIHNSNCERVSIKIQNKIFMVSLCWNCFEGMQWCHVYTHPVKGFGVRRMNMKNARLQGMIYLEFISIYFKVNLLSFVWKIKTKQFKYWECQNQSKNSLVWQEVSWTVMIRTF